jgi:uncharacterized protein DUF6745
MVVGVEVGRTMIRKLDPVQLGKIENIVRDTLYEVNTSTAKAAPDQVESALRLFWDDEYGPFPTVTWVGSPLLGVVSMLNPGTVRGFQAYAERRLFGDQIDMARNSGPGWVRVWPETTTSAGASPPVTIRAELSGGLVVSSNTDDDWFRKSMNALALQDGLKFRYVNGQLINTSHQLGMIAFPQLTSTTQALMYAEAQSQFFDLMARLSRGQRSQGFIGAKIPPIQNAFRQFCNYGRSGIPTQLDQYVGQWPEPYWKIFFKVFSWPLFSNCNYDGWLSPDIIARLRTIRYLLGDDADTEWLRKVEAAETLAMFTCGFWPYPGLGISVAPRPTTIHVNNQLELHHADKQAVTWPDGWGFSMWNGEHVPDWNSDWTLARVAQAGGEADGRVLERVLTRIGWAKIIRSAGIEMMDPLIAGGGHSLAEGTITINIMPSSSPAQDPGNPGQVLRMFRLAVFRGTRVFDRHVLVCTNGTPEADGSVKEYALTVPDRVWNDPIAAAAWAYGVKPKTYRQLARRT